MPPPDILIRITGILGKCKHGITLLYLFPQKCYHYTNSILQKKDIHMKFLILLIIALVISSIGFKKIVWFISLGYCFSIAGIGVDLIVLFFKELTIPTLVMSLLFIVYGYRLDGYLMIRERKSICRNDRRADHWAASD